MANLLLLVAKANLLLHYFWCLVGDPVEEDLHRSKRVGVNMSGHGMWTR